MLIDGEEKKAGSLFEDFDPSVNPSEEIDDPSDKKPSDWVENPKCAPQRLQCLACKACSQVQGPCLHSALYLLASLPAHIAQLCSTGSDWTVRAKTGSSVCPAHDNTLAHQP